MVDQQVVVVDLQVEQVGEVAQQAVQVVDLEVGHLGEVLEAEHAHQVLGDREVDQEVQVDLGVVALVAQEDEVEEGVEEAEDVVISGVK